jgi:hypothetical protein
MNSYCFKLFSVLYILFFQTLGLSQENKLKLNLNDSGSSYIKGSIRGQFWMRYNEMNPGTVINGEPVDNKLDFSIRRFRVNVTAQLNPKLFVYGLFGGNNINLGSEKEFEFDVLDLYVEYSFNKKIAIGMGESTWDGLSRWTARSSYSMMSLDAPLFSLLTVNKNDDLARTLGIWLKGQIGKFDYIFSLKNPNDYGVISTEGKTDFALNNPRTRTSGYVKYELLDNESNKTSYSGGTGTYLGTKNIFNIGGGFLFQPKMTSSLVNGEEQFYDFKNLSAELFFDKQLNTDKNTAITSYLGFFNTDFGPNYIRNLGANDYTSGGTSFNGSGNDFPMMGTGKTIFFQLGYLTGKGKKGYQFQPNISIQRSDFEALNDIMIVYDAGINLYFKGHANKLSLNYQSRPIYLEDNLGNLIVNERKGQMVLQYQIVIN